MIVLPFLPPQLARYAVELRVVTGSPVEGILETAARARVSLIVLGTHGRTGLTHAIMGSVAERVVRLSSCPVLTVKVSAPEEKGWLHDVSARFMSPQLVERTAEKGGSGCSPTLYLSPRPSVPHLPMGQTQAPQHWQKGTYEDADPVSEVAHR